MQPVTESLYVQVFLAKYPFPRERIYRIEENIAKLSSRGGRAFYLRIKEFATRSWLPFYQHVNLACLTKLGEHVDGRTSSHATVYSMVSERCDLNSAMSSNDGF
jgi:hypothetical protein